MRDESFKKNTVNIFRIRIPEYEKLNTETGLLFKILIKEKFEKQIERTYQVTGKIIPDCQL